MLVPLNHCYSEALKPLSFQDFLNGIQCGSPALRRNRFCFFQERLRHEGIRVAAERSACRYPATFTLSVLEDANSIQIALMEVMRLILSRQDRAQNAGLLLYARQAASGNLRRTRFDANQHDIML